MRNKPQITVAAGFAMFFFLLMLTSIAREGTAREGVLNPTLLLGQVCTSICFALFIRCLL